MYCTLVQSTGHVYRAAFMSYIVYKTFSTRKLFNLSRMTDPVPYYKDYQVIVTRYKYGEKIHPIVRQM